MLRCSLDDHLLGLGPKRILALDGGGVRGILSLAYIERIEDLLRGRYGNDSSFRLSDYFDLIGGTSTGAIIASGLALGHSAAELVEQYRKLSGEAFKKSHWSLGIFGSKFPKEPLETLLKEGLGEHTLGSGALRTGLAVVAKRLDTGSPWILHNNPRGKYFDAPSDDPDAFPNRDMLLRHVVRASTAAPTFFEPEFLTIAEGKVGAFIDGGVSPYNNPALMMLMAATVHGYGFNWSIGESQLMLVSLGTGTHPTRLRLGTLRRTPRLMLAAHALRSLMDDCKWQAQMILQWMSATRTPWLIDTEAGDLSDDNMLGRKLLTYLRYDVILDEDWIYEHFGKRIAESELRRLEKIDQPKNLERILDLGREAAASQIKPSHFPAAFDLGAD